MQWRDVERNCMVAGGERARARGRDIEGCAARAIGEIGPRGEHEIGIHALRGSDIVGEHTVHFIGPNERLELVHRAEARRVRVGCRGCGAFSTGGRTAFMRCAICRDRDRAVSARAATDPIDAVGKARPFASFGNTASRYEWRTRRARPRTMRRNAGPFEDLSHDVHRAAAGGHRPDVVSRSHLDEASVRCDAAEPATVKANSPRVRVRLKEANLE